MCTYDEGGRGSGSGVHLAGTGRRGKEKGGQNGEKKEMGFSSALLYNVRTAVGRSAMFFRSE